MAPLTDAIDADALADMVVLTVQAALAPIVARLAVAEARAAEVPALLLARSELRERLIAVETRATDPPVVANLSAVTEDPRIAPLVTDVGVLRERVAVVETKAAVPLDLPPVTPTVEEDPRIGPLVADVGVLRERLAVVETKADLPRPPSVVIPPAVAEDLRVGPLVADVGALRERLTVVETKAVMPGPEPLAIDLRAHVEARLAALDERLRAESTTPEPDPRVAALVADVAALRERVASMADVPTAAISTLRDRLVEVETRTPTKALWDDLQTAAMRSAEARAELVTTVTKDVGALSQRLGVIEGRAAVPGPAGRDGTDGTPGAPGVHGRDGRDGLGFDDLDVTFDGYATLTLRFTRGADVKEFPLSLPFLRYLGVYQDGQKYVRGDVVTWAGSTWHCNEPTTTKAGDGSKAWTLMVKRGRDGKDGTDGRDGGLPVVAVRKP